MSYIEFRNFFSNDTNDRYRKLYNFYITAKKSKYTNYNYYKS